ncbi:MAG TPA: aldo/keto reductase, partial [Thermomicrobiales bacterium]|nr:aldo/keto reductase [Thermomicrobiales bacterium]
MQGQRIGQSDLEVSAIGLGTWPMGDARYGPRDDHEAERTITTALDAGVTCFDTAPIYGNGHAEELLGKALTG